MIDTGAGAPIVVVPGVQGRWEWMQPTVTALAEHHRVLSFSLGEAVTDDGGDVFDQWLRYIDAMVDRAGLRTTALMGVSFGGLVAALYAARRPERVSSLVLVSAPSPRMPLDRSSAVMVRLPRLAVPAFAVRGVFRLGPEILAAPWSWTRRLTFAATHVFRTIRFPLSPRRTARWVEAWHAHLTPDDCRSVTAPTLLLTGEPHLDRVVPVASTREYLHLIRDARHETLPWTGHLGLISRPQEFARMVGAFLAAHADSSRADERTIGKVG